MTLKQEVKKFWKNLEKRGIAYPAVIWSSTNKEPHIEETVRFIEEYIELLYGNTSDE